MREWLIGLWQDEARFRAFARGVIAMAGALAPLVPGVPPWVAPVIIAASQFIAAGQRNVEGVKK
jgi:hypothetical protein